MVSRRQILGGAAALLLSRSGVGRADLGEAPSEYDVKAAYLYNFAKFIQWPADAFGRARDLVLGVVGEDPFEGSLDRVVQNKTVQGRRIVIRHVRTIVDAASCHILFVSASESTHVASILRSLNTAPVLTVSDIPGFSSRGGTIEMFLEHNRVRFAVNLKAAERARLTVSSQLLKVAKTVRT